MSISSWVAPPPSLYGATPFARRTQASSEWVQGESHNASVFVTLSSWHSGVYPQRQGFHFRFYLLAAFFFGILLTARFLYGSFCSYSQ